MNDWLWEFLDHSCKYCCQYQVVFAILFCILNGTHHCWMVTKLLIYNVDGYNLSMKQWTWNCWGKSKNKWLQDVWYDHNKVKLEHIPGSKLKSWWISCQSIWFPSYLTILPILPGLIPHFKSKQSLNILIIFIADMDNNNVSISFRPIY